MQYCMRACTPRPERSDPNVYGKTRFTQHERLDGRSTQGLEDGCGRYRIALCWSKCSLRDRIGVIRAIRNKVVGSLICSCSAAPDSSGRIWCAHAVLARVIVSRYSRAAAELPTYLPRLFD